MIPVLRFAASSTMKSDTNSKQGHAILQFHHNPSLGRVRAVFGHLQHIICLLAMTQICSALHVLCNKLVLLY